MNARIPVLLLALSVVALPAPSQAQSPQARNSCNNTVRTLLTRVEAKYAATTVLTEANHARYKRLHAALRPNGTMEACMNRRTDLVALEAALEQMIAEPKAGNRLRGGVIVDVAEGGTHGLVAYPEDQPGGTYFDTRVVGLSSADAVKSCDNLVGGGFSDWYLPSYEELDRVWKQRAAISKFHDDRIYWTSGYWGSRTTRQTVTWSNGKWGYKENSGDVKDFPTARCVRKF